MDHKHVSTHRRPPKSSQHSSLVPSSQQPTDPVLIQRALEAPDSLTPEQVNLLQATYGNHFASRLCQQTQRPKNGEHATVQAQRQPAQNVLQRSEVEFGGFKITWGQDGLQSNQFHAKNMIEKDPKPERTFTIPKKLFGTRPEIKTIESRSGTNKAIIVVKSGDNVDLWQWHQAAESSTPLKKQKLERVLGKEDPRFRWQSGVRGKKIMDGLDPGDSLAVLAGKIFDNMRDSGLKYVPEGGGDAFGVLEGAITEGDCMHLSRAFAAAVWSAGTAYGTQGTPAQFNTLIEDHSQPFLTRDFGGGESLIGFPDGPTNIVQSRQDGVTSKYTGSKIKFDNHTWVKLNGQNYDIVAGVKAGNDIVGDDLTKQDETWTGGGHTISKVTEPKPRKPFESGYLLS